ncbi:hypothetical protein F5146DRAFT_998799 [Armillaria mellea]|nr:hypothetical protein F5146DRAFT_998799 [Armillaria mellea]
MSKGSRDNTESLLRDVEVDGKKSSANSEQTLDGWLLVLEQQTSKKSRSELGDRRLKDKPLQYILGSQQFGGLDLIVRPPVLILRPETEDWTIMPSPARPISVLGLKRAVSTSPLTLATENTARYNVTGGMRNTSELSKGTSWFQSSKPPFDVLTSDPPYISWKEYLKLSLSVVRYEDPKALFCLVSKPDDLIALEVGQDQAEEVEDILRDTGEIR